MLVTASARNFGTDVNQLAVNSIARWNNILYNGNIQTSPSTMSLAAVVDIPTFIETNITDDVNIYLPSNANAQSLRNQYSADIVVLIAYYQGGPLGKAAGIDVTDPYYAYVICKIDGFIDFADLMSHEICHLFGGLHRLDYSQGVAYAHGAIIPTCGGSCTVQTIMCTPSDGDRYNHISAFSNPNVPIGGLPGGDNTDHNVARRIVESAPRIANFRDEPFSANISGASYISSYGSYSYDAVGMCGAAPFNYLWSASTDGFNYVTFSSYGEFFSFPIYPHAAHWIYLRVTMTDATSATASTFFHVSYDPNLQITVKDDHSLPSINTNLPKNYVLLEGDDLLIDVYPNPVNTSTTFSYYVPEKGLVESDLLDIQGRLIKVITKNVHERGSFETQINTSTLPDGVYIYRVATSKSILTKRVVIQK